MSPIEDREPAGKQIEAGDTPLAELMCAVIGLADEVVEARLANGELARRRELIKSRPRGTAPAAFRAAEPVDATARREAAETVAAARVQAAQIVAESRRRAAGMLRSGRAPGTAAIRRRSALLVLAVVLLGLAGTGSTVAAVRRGHTDLATRAFAEQTQNVARAVSAGFDRSVTSLGYLAAAISAQDRLDAASFATMADAIDRARLPGATGAGFVVAADSDQVPQVQADWRARGAAGLVLRPNRDHSSHFFEVLDRPDAGSADLRGLDLAATEFAGETLRRSRDSRQAAVSSPYRLLRDVGLPPEQQQMSVLLAAPVYATSTRAPDHDQFRGWVVVGLHLADLLHDIGTDAGDNVAVSLSDDGPGSAPAAPAARAGPDALVAWWPHGAAGHDLPSGVASIVVAQRRWEVRVTATASPAPGRSTEAGILITGSVLTLLIAFLVGAAVTARDRDRRRLDRAVAALCADIPAAEPAHR